MTQRQIFQRLITIAAIEHRPASNQPWTAADLVDQEALYTIQSELLGLLLEVAKGIDEAAVAKIVKKFPWAFRSSPEAT